MAPIRMASTIRAGVAFVLFLAVSACGTQQEKMIEYHGAQGGPSIKLKADDSSPARSTITREHFRLLRVGLSSHEVTDILGPAFFEAGSGATVTMQWTDIDRKKNIHIVFENDKATQVSAAGMDQDPEKATRGNFNAVLDGMTETEVEKLVGPSETVSINGKNTTLVWQPKGAYAMVQLVDGKVTNKIIETR